MDLSPGFASEIIFRMAAAMGGIPKDSAVIEKMRKEQRDDPQFAGNPSIVAKKKDFTHALDVKHLGLEKGGVEIAFANVPSPAGNVIYEEIQLSRTSRTSPSHQWREKDHSDYCARRMVDGELEAEPFGQFIKLLGQKTGLRPTDMNRLSLEPKGYAVDAVRHDYGSFDAQPAPAKQTFYLRFHSDQRQAVFKTLCDYYKTLTGRSMMDRLLQEIHPHAGPPLGRQ